METKTIKGLTYRLIRVEGDTQHVKPTVYAHAEHCTEHIALFTLEVASSKHHRLCAMIDYVHRDGDSLAADRPPRICLYELPEYDEAIPTIEVGVLWFPDFVGFSCTILSDGKEIQLLMTKTPRP